MKTIFIVLAVVISGITNQSLAQQFKTPVDYHNYIVNEQQKVVDAMIAFSNQFNSKDSILLSNYNKTKAILKKSSENIRNLPSYYGDNELRDAAVPLFDMYYSAMDIEYREIVDLFIKKDFGKKTQDRVNSLLLSINEREKKLDGRLIQAQDNFARKYQLTIQQNQTQQKVNSIGK